MNIQEVVEAAIKEDKYMRKNDVRENESAYHKLKIKPTNSSAKCIVYTFNQKGNQAHHCKNWQPTAEDLMATDWKLSD